MKLRNLILYFLLLIPGISFAQTFSYGLDAVSLINSKDKFFNVSEALKKRDVLFFFLDPKDDKDKAILVKLDEIYKKYGNYWDIVGVGIGKFSKDEFYRFANKNVSYQITIENYISALEDFSYGGLRSFFVVDQSGRVIKLAGEVSFESIIAYMAESAYQRGYYDASFSLYESIIASNKTDIKAITGLAYSNLAAGKGDDARKRFEGLTKKGSLSGRMGLAYYYYKEGNYENVKSILSQSANSQGIAALGMYHLLRGHMLLFDGKLESARKSFRAAVNAPPEHLWIRAQAYNMLATTFVQKGAPRQGLMYLEKALIDNPFNLDVLSNSAFIYKTTGQDQFAWKIYKTIKDLFPKDVVSSVFLKEFEEFEDFQKDEKEQARLEFLFRKLEKNFKKGESKRSVARFDPWTSIPMKLFYLPFEGKMLNRIDFSEGIGKKIFKEITQSNMVTAVPIYKSDMFIKRLGLSDEEVLKRYSELAMSFASRYALEGFLYDKGNYIKVKAYIWDVIEGKELVRVESTIKEDDITSNAGVLDKIAGQLVKGMTDANALQGKVAGITEDGMVIVNLGARHGLKVGMEMNVFRDIRSEPEIRRRGVGSVVITDIMRDVSYAEDMVGEDYIIGDRLRLISE